MLAKNMSNVLPVIIMVLFLVILSMMAISYFGVNMNVTDGIRNLNRSATFEGMDNKKEYPVEPAVLGNKNQTYNDKLFSSLKSTFSSFKISSCKKVIILTSLL